MQEQEGRQATGGGQALAAAAPAYQQLGQLAQNVWEQVNQNFEKEEGEGN